MRTQKEYQTLLKNHQKEVKTRHKNKEAEQKRLERQIAREIKMKAIREKKFEEELLN